MLRSHREVAESFELNLRITIHAFEGDDIFSKPCRPLNSKLTGRCSDGCYRDMQARILRFEASTRHTTCYAVTSFHSSCSFRKDLEEYHYQFHPQSVWPYFAQDA